MRRMKHVPTPQPAEEPEEESTAINPVSHYNAQDRASRAQRMMAQGATQHQVSAMLMQQEPGLSPHHAKNTYYLQLKELRLTYEKEMPYHRAMQLQRLHNDLLTMRSDRVAANLAKHKKRPTLADIRQHELLIAKITGTLAPIKVVVDDPNEVLSSSIKGIIAGMTPEETAELIAEGETIEDNASLFDEGPK